MSPSNGAERTREVTVTETSEQFQREGNKEELWSLKAAASYVVN